MASSVVFVIQICLIQYALSQQANIQTTTNIDQVETNARNVQVEGQLPILKPGPVIETSTKVPVVPNQHNTFGSHIVPTSNDFLLTNLGISKAVIPRTSTNEARNIQLEGQITTQGAGLVKDTLANAPGVPKTPINPYKPLLANNNAFMNPSMANIGLGIGVSRQAVNGARNVQLQGQLPILEPGPVSEPSTKVPVVPNQHNIYDSHIIPNGNELQLTNLAISKTVIPRTPSKEARNIQLGGQITTQGAGLVKDTLANVPAVPNTPINPYKPLLANNNAFMNPSMANIGLGIGVSRQAVNGARNVQLQGQLPILEPGPVIEPSTKIPVAPNQHNTYGSQIAPTSNNYLSTNLGMSKTVIPRTSTNEARNIQLEGQITTQGAGLVKDTLANIPAVPKTPINPYKPLLANNNAFMNPSMANIGLGIGVSRQASNGAGMPMPNQKFNGAGMPKMAQGESGTGAVGVSDEWPMMWRNVRKTSRTYDW